MIAYLSAPTLATPRPAAVLARARPVSPRFRLLSIRADRRHRQLTVTLELPGPGALRLSVSAATDTLASLRRREAARTSPLTVVLSLRPSPRGILGARGSQTLRVVATFTPAGGPAHSLMRTITLAPTQK